MKHIHIRPCTPEDIEGVLELDKQWEQEDIAHEFLFVTREELVLKLEHFPAYFLVAVNNGSVIAYVNASVRLGRQKGMAIIAEQEPCLQIENIYVKKELRNRGIGGELMEGLFEAAKQRGIRRFLLATDSKDMERVLRFYRRHGFQPWSVQMFK